MAYAEIADLKVHMKSTDIVGFVNDEGLANDTEAEADTALANVTVEAIVQTFLDEAANEIDGWILGHVDTTNATVQAQLKQHNAIVALFNMACRSQIGVGEGLEKRYTNTMRWLRDIAQGRIVLKTSSEDPGPTANSPHRTRDRVFAGTEITGYINLPS